MASTTTETHTLIVGAGQSGLATAYHLRKLGITPVLVDSNSRVGDSWRNRWDSLRLFTPARFNHLPGMAFPAGATSFPSKDEVADYLEIYADTFELDPQLGVTVSDVTRAADGRMQVECGSTTCLASNVVISGGYYRQPNIPPLHAALSPNIVQLHSSEYKNPTQLSDGQTLVVGAGNSGAEIAMDIARSGRPVNLAGDDVQQVPFQPDSPLGRTLFLSAMRFVSHHVVNTGTVVGRRAYDKLAKTTSPVVRVRPADLAHAGIGRLPRVVGVRDGCPELADGAVQPVSNLIWATGFVPDFSWISCLEMAPGDRPNHHRGVSDQQPGLFFVGLFFQYAMSSSLLTGVGRDAQHVARAIANGSI